MEASAPPAPPTRFPASSEPAPMTPARRLVITLPLPRKALSPNARGHWSSKARAVKAYRTLAWAESLAHDPAPRWARATAQASFFFMDARSRDGDNLLASLKSAFDGLADAGIVANDSGITHLPPKLGTDKARPRVEIEIWETAP